MTEKGLLLKSELGVPTHFSNNIQNSETTIDLQWDSPYLYYRDIVGKTDVFSSSKVYWKLFAKRAFTSLQPLCLTDHKNLTSQTSIHDFALRIEQEIITAQQEAFPLVQIKQSSRQRLDADTLNPIKVHFPNLQQKAQRAKAQDNKVNYGAVQAKLPKQVKHTKHHHWH